MRCRRGKPSGAGDAGRGERRRVEEQPSALGRGSEGRGRGGDGGVQDARRRDPPGGCGRRGDPLGRPADAAVLRGAAVALNTFSSDGSFLERFKDAGAAPDSGEPLNPKPFPRGTSRDPSLPLPHPPLSIL